MWRRTDHEIERTQIETRRNRISHFANEQLRRFFQRLVEVSRQVENIANEDDVRFESLDLSFQNLLFPRGNVAAEWQRLSPKTISLLLQSLLNFQCERSFGVDLQTIFVGPTDLNRRRVDDELLRFVSEF